MELIEPTLIFIFLQNYYFWKKQNVISDFIYE